MKIWVCIAEQFFYVLADAFGPADGYCDFHVHNEAVGIVREKFPAPGIFGVVRFDVVTDGKEDNGVDSIFVAEKHRTPVRNHTIDVVVAGGHLSVRPANPLLSHKCHDVYSFHDTLNVATMSQCTDELSDEHM